MAGTVHCDTGLLCCSEPEAAALLALATQFKPHVWMNVHSGMEALFMPYDHLAAIPKGATAQATLEASKPPHNSMLGRTCAYAHAMQESGPPGCVTAPARHSKCLYVLEAKG